jgi:Glycosyl transferase family 2
MRVSAALIVRDEADFIEDCLASISDVVDEIVLVDTGSKDDTIDKARRFPVKLHFFKWVQDFSAARNFAIEQSSGDWILYIDADERLEVKEPGVWREVVDDQGKAGWKLRFYPRVGWTAYAELRLFRNHPRIRFSGVIHERIHDTVKEVCRSDALTIGSCELAIRHVGYEGGSRHKISRNVPLLRDYLLRDPSRVYCWWHLGQMLLLDGDEGGAAEAWRKGMEAARASSQAGPLSDAMPFFSLLLLEHSRGTAIDELLAEAVQLFSGHLALRWLACRYAVERGEFDGAREVLEKLAAIDPETFVDASLSYDRQLFSYLAPETLALGHYRAGRFREAAEWYRRAAANAPDPQSCEVKAQLAQAKALPSSRPATFSP